MKGIAHFVTGIAIATFFPEVVQQAGQGSLLPLLGGIAGILPDTIDFKFVRYWEKYDDEIDPGPDLMAQEVAARVARAMQRAYETGKPQHVMLHTVRLGADAWRQYAIRFDTGRNVVAVRVGPIVSTGQIPLPGSEPENGQEARAKVGAPMAYTYDEEITIDILTGPSLKFERQGEEVRVHFLAWHRRWSHSLTLAAALGLLSGILLGKWAGLVVGLGLVGHILEDQLGHMGSNLLYPFTKRRSGGLRLLHSGDAIPNFLTVWTAVALILFNLDRFSGQSLLNPWWFLGLAIALPAVVMGALYGWQRRRQKPRSKETLQQRDIVSEAEEADF